MSNWQTYYDKHLSRPVRPLVQKAVSFCRHKDFALDLGAGTLVESKFLLDSGFRRVLAVDSSTEIEVFARGLNDERLQVLVNPFRDLVLAPESFDFITAQFALPFYGQQGFEQFFAELLGSLKPDGVITGQLFGERDSWNLPESKLAFHTKQEALKLLSSLDIKEFEEEEKEGTTARNEIKHWHIFHFIALK